MKMGREKKGATMNDAIVGKKAALFESLKQQFVTSEERLNEKRKGCLG